MKKIFIENAKYFLKLEKQKKVLELKLNEIEKKQGNLYFYPFNRYAISLNASYVFYSILRHPDRTYKYSNHLSNKDGSGMYFSDETFKKDLPKIFKHFKEVGILIKKRNEYILNPLLRNVKNDLNCD